MDELKIEKHVNDDMVAWRISCEGIAPNTVLKPDDGIMLVVKLNGQKQTLAGRYSTVYALYDPRDRKLFGGKKPYSPKDIEIYAVDQRSKFEAEWGLAGNNALKCKDAEFDVDCAAIATGKYSYVINNFVTFIDNMEFDGNGKIKRDFIREKLRSEVTAIIRDELNELVLQYGLNEAQSKLNECARRIGKQLNEKLQKYGIEVDSFNIKSLDYSPEHMCNRERLKNAKVNTVITKIDNEAKASTLQLEREKADIELPRAIVEHGDSKLIYNYGENRLVNEVNNVYCGNCGAKNSKNSNFCNKCGKPLKK